MANSSPSAQTPSQTRGLWRRWTIAFTLGELIGFGGVPALGGILTWLATQSLDPVPRALTLYAVSVIGGLAEGGILAWFQLRVLRTVLPGIEAKRWIVHTAVAAAIAWALGMLAPTIDEVVALPVLAQIAIWLPATVLILLSIGYAQSIVLAPLVARPRRWLWANVLGWLLGLPWTFVMPAMLPDKAPAAVFAATMIASGILMGATTGAVTGRCLLTLEPISKTGPSQVREARRW